jgi:aminoglycoside phosphotransferase (APT) family kinase protein
VDGGTTPVAAAGLLADLHTRLHAVPPRRARHGADRILHLDLHPGNVILSPDGPVLIDWCNTAEGSPDLDIALTALILAEVAAGSYLPDFAAPARQLLTAFRQLAGGSPLDQLDHAVAYRSAMSTLSPDEKSRLSTAAHLVVTSGNAASSYE